MSGSTLRERIRERRQKIKETLGHSDHEILEEEKDEDSTGPRMKSEPESGDIATTTDEEEAAESRKMMQTIHRRRQQNKEKLLEQAKRAEDDQDGMSSARRRIRERMRSTTAAQLAAKQEEEEEEEARRESEEEVRRTPDTDTSESPHRTPSPQRTPRPTSRPDKRGSVSISRTLGMSIQQRLLKKIEKARSEARDELDKDEEPVGRLRGLRGRTASTRFDESALGKAEEQLERSLTLRAKRQDMKKRKKPWMPTQEESYDFFTRNWEHVPEPEPAAAPAFADANKPAADEDAAQPSTSQQADATNEGEDEEDGKKRGKKKKKKKEEEKKEEEEDKPEEKVDDKPEEEQPLISSDDLEIMEPYLFYAVARADYTPFRETMERENNIYFYPSIRRAAIEERIFEQEAPRYLEEEGFYVGRKPAVPRTNLHRLENRLLKHERKRWFGEDGEVMALPDPLKDVPSRPPIPEELPLYLSIMYMKAVIQEIDSRIISGSLEGQGPYQLDVDINTLLFQHHHLYSREHVLASQLTQAYQQYHTRHKRKITAYLTDKLKALKSASQHMQENIAIMKHSSQDVDTTEQQRLFEEYMQELRVTRTKRDKEMELDRSLLKKILKLWKDIKQLRQLQGYTNTTVKLNLRKEVTDKAAEEAEWETEVSEEVEELLQESSDKYNQQMADYKEQLNRWKQQKLAKKEAQKRQKTREKKQRRSRTSAEEATADDIKDELNDQKILNEAYLDKPEKPQLPDANTIRQSVIARMEQIRRKPGEVKLHPDLTNGASISPNTSCPKPEQMRRNEVNRTKIYVKVIFNGKEVSQTPSKPLGQDFVVRFAQIISIQILQWPEKIELEVYEMAGISSTLMAKLYTPIPDPSVTSDTVLLDEYSFSTDYRVTHSHEGVGSGVEISLTGDNRDSVFENTTGLLSASVCWATDELGNVLIPPTTSRASSYYSAMKGVDAIAAIGASGMADMDKLSKWIAKSRLDPNDPDNAELMFLMRPVGEEDATMLRMPDYFRLEQLQEEFNFATDEDIDESPRFRLLQLRDNEIQEFRNYQQVPCFDREVPRSTFEEYEKSLVESEQINLKDRASHRTAVAQFMKKVREQVMIRFNILARQKALEDVVYEEQVPNIGTLLPNLMKLVEPRRPLRPKRKKRKKMMPQNLQQSEVKLLVNIVRAIDVPVRADSAPPSMPSQGTIQPSQSLRGSLRLTDVTSQVQVRPFVEVTFQRNNKTTTVAEGPNPSWNEELALPFKARNSDYSPTNLQQVKEMIYINLFDEFIIDLMQDDNEGRNIHRRIERKWLGSIKIPFSTVYFNTRIDGTFRINRPTVLLGYRNDTSQILGDRDPDAGMMGEPGNTYITLFITVEPALPPSEAIIDKFETNEDRKLLLDSDKWLMDLEKKFPGREFKTTVTDINGKAVFVTRYLNKLRPPEMLINDQPNEITAVERVARYVSMIPFISDSVVFPGIVDIWSTCDQFLQMLQGDEEEHAVLLANYFLYMGKTAFLLLGVAIPEGPTAYVLTQEPNDFWIWNASTGEHYSYRDNYCPIVSVGCLVNPDNIWANIQPVVQPARVSFDISNPSNWKPFFHKRYPNPGLSTVQPETFNYDEPNKESALDLQDEIERKLKEKIMSWRPRHITRWNRNCIQVFRRILPRLEENLGKSIQSEQMAELQAIIGNNKLSGFPINVQFTDVDSIVETVYATGVHNHQTNDVEFALAVYVHPYPAYVYSVWIYVASLTKSR